MPGTNTQHPYKILDVRHLPRAHREFRQLEALSSLAPGCSFVVVFDDAPKSFIRHLETECKDKFRWTMLHAGPDLWRILITRKMLWIEH